MATSANQANTVPDLNFLGSIHEGIPVATEILDKCIEFYVKVFGLKILERPKALDQFGPGAWLTDHDGTVQFHLIANDETLVPAGKAAKIEPAGRHTAWRIHDVEAFRERMNGLGVPFEEIGSLIGEAQLFVLDPQGHTWEFQGPPGSAK